MASRYREKADVSAAVGLSKTFLALKPRLGDFEEKNLKAPIRAAEGWNIGDEWRKEESVDLG